MLYEKLRVKAEGLIEIAKNRVEEKEWVSDLERKKCFDNFETDWKWFVGLFSLS